MKWINEHAEFLKGLAVGTGGIFVSFLDFILPVAQAMLVIVTLLYTCWKFYRDYKRNMQRNKSK